MVLLRVFHGLQTYTFLWGEAALGGGGRGAPCVKDALLVDR